VRRALKILADREVTPQTGLLKSTLLQLDSTFSERSYGASSFLDFANKLAEAGLVQLKHSGRSVTVELVGTFDEIDAAAAGTAPGVPILPGSETRTVEGTPGVLGQMVTPAGLPNGAGGEPRPFDQRPPDLRPPVEVIGDATEGARLVADILRSATNARWPMYIRNVKQLLRAANFDERAYGFGGLMDLLRACQRDGFMRVERDRRRGLRVFPGAALGPVGVSRGFGGQSSAAQASDSIGNEAASFAGDGESSYDADNIGNVVDPRQMRGVPDVSEDEADLVEDAPAMVVDTTAELLGRAKARKPRVRAAVAVAPRRTAKKPAGTRKTARRKSTDSDE
jgi:hypothetical protein